MRVLGIESSCDDTAIAIYDSEQGLLAHQWHSQIARHQAYGGVVPELASRDHLSKVLPLTDQALAEAGCTASDIDGVAYTAGPGLIGALLVGACFGRSLAYAWGLPSVGVHHLEAHLLAPMLEDDPPAFPFLALLVSGGHTMLIAVEGLGQYRLLGETLDDAVGEAFDKTAKLMGLPYPGGPEIAALAEQPVHACIDLPRPMVNRPGLDFSFSGLKTHVRNAWGKTAKDQQAQIDIAHAFQTAVVDTLAIKLKRAMKATNYTRCVVAGGVGANVALRKRLNALAEEMGLTMYYPRMAFCTDNGAMVAYAGCQRLLIGQRDDMAINVRPRWPLTET